MTWQTWTRLAGEGTGHSSSADVLICCRPLTVGPSPTMTAYRNLEGPVSFTKEQAGRDEQCVSFEMTTTESSDGSIAAGDGPWSLCFVSTDDGWRLYDQGAV